MVEEEEIESRDVTLSMYITEKDGLLMEGEDINVRVPLDMPTKEVLNLFVKSVYVGRIK